MKIDDAIHAHAHWKTLLMAYLKIPDRLFNVIEIEADNRCALGKWLHGEATKKVPPEDLAALKAAHARFHRAAADVIRKVDAGLVSDPDKLLGLSSEFGKASLAVVNLLKAQAPA
jgi:hypothetical protein